MFQVADQLIKMRCYFQACRSKRPNILKKGERTKRKIKLKKHVVIDPLLTEPVECLSCAIYLFHPYIFPGTIMFFYTIMFFLDATRLDCKYIKRNQVVSQMLTGKAAEVQLKFLEGHLDHRTTEYFTIVGSLSLGSV